jgi:nitrite reductase/ring-hydroxylating ferredoxin subunit
MPTMCDNTPPEANLVAPQDACPVCGERDIDRLVWVDDEWVRCLKCNIEYDPVTGGRHEPS